ncbi:MAG: TlpA family protein disulfide reductase [Candidatus Limnocylindrales bacterium]
MTQRSRDSRRDAARSREGTRRPGWLLPGLGALVVVAAALVAVALSGSGDGGSSALPTDLPGASAVASDSTAPGTDPVISGAALPVYGDPAADPAVGQAIPTVTAAGGSIALDGRAKILVFLAHWCSHCQAEVPVVQAWLDAGGLPEDVDLVSVSTAIDPNRPNYPPEAWLAREGWTSPVIVDPANTVADAFGLSAFPYFVFVHADGTVGARATGELAIADLEAIVDGLRRSR